MYISRNIPRILLWVGVVICLLQVWIPEYYVTGDGPCHVYNARMLYDHLRGVDIDFYSQYYTFPGNINPNWFGHVALAMLMFVVNGLIAEKIFISLYILLFVFGFKKFAETFVQKYDGYAALAGLLFVFHHLLSKGFYNFTMSIALMLWAAFFWIKFQHTGRFKYYPAFVVLLLLVFFAHPVGFVLTGVVCVSVLLIMWLQADKGSKKSIWKNAAILLGTFLPFIIMLKLFADNQSTGLSGMGFFHTRINDLIRFPFLITHSNIEEVPARLISVTLMALFGVVIIKRIAGMQKLRNADALLLVILFCLVVFFTFPDNLFGGGIFIIRMQVVLLFVMLYIISQLNKLQGSIFILAGFGGFLFLSAVRISAGQRSSEAAHDYLSAAAYIKPYSVVLPLSFNHNGCTPSGELAVERNWVFLHIGEYIGVKKPMIFLENYEALTGYFPFLWRWEVNPFAHLSSGEGIESQRPFAQIEQYRQNTGVTIDYILTSCYREEYYQGHVKQLMDEITAHYNPIYVSASKRTILYARKAEN